MTDWWNSSSLVFDYAGSDTFIVRMMNVVQEQGTYWVANGFIWDV